MAYKKTKHIVYPLRLRSDFNTFKLNNNLRVRRMSLADKERFLKIKNPIYDADENLKSWQPLEGCLIDIKLLSGEYFGVSMEFCSSNYMLIAANADIARAFNFAIKIISDSKSGIYMGFRNGDRFFFYPPTYYGSEGPLRVEKTTTTKVKKLINQIESAHKDNTLLTIIDMFHLATSPSLRDESRFIELTIILEMLLLPSQSQELRYRFSLRMAKLLNKLYKGPLEATYEKAQDIYDIRSRLVHSGKHRKCKAMLPIAFEYTRLLVSAYLENKDMFTDDNLNKLCLL